MKITSKPLALIILVILFGGIAVTTAMGWWSTESNKQAAVFTEGEFAGLPNPADIRGSYTFGDVEKNFGVPATELALAFNLPAKQDPAAFQVKSLEAFYTSLPEGVEIGTTSVRLFTAFYSGLPYDLSGDTFLPLAAVDLLKTKSSLTAEQISYLDEHAVILQEGSAAPQISPTPAVAATHTSSETTRTVKGITTFAEILGWGVPQSTIEQIIGKPMPDPVIKVKDFCTSKGLSFETIKPALQAEVDKLPAP